MNTPARPAPNAAFRTSILRGLTAPVKTAEPKHFYDAEGSRLFDLICQLPEYYPTRTETEILRRKGAEMAEAMRGAMIDAGGAQAPERTALLELGAGSTIKVRLLLDRMPWLSSYVPLDISADHLAASAQALEADYPHLDVRPLSGDFTQELRLPGDLAERPKSLFFPGSTLGNFDLAAAGALLRRMRDLPGAGAFLIGIDLVKDPQVLVDAYDDAQGVTAAFNRNLLSRINAELGADFNLERFVHEARWNARESRIEMHLVSTRRQRVTVDGVAIDFAEGESIHTENSYKYSLEGFAALAEGAGWRSERHWCDPKELFCVQLLR